jgi:PAS domain S-box-containing protein
MDEATGCGMSSNISLVDNNGGYSMLVSRNFLVIFLFAAIAMAVPLVHLHLNASDRQAFIESQLTGLLIVEQMDGLLRDILLHRGLLFSVMNGHSEFDEELQRVEMHIEHNLQQLRLSHTELAHISVSPEQAYRLHNDWLELKRQQALSQSADAVRVFEQHNLYMDTLVELIRHVTDHSKLILDPHLDSYYLMDVVVNQTPELINNLGKVRGFASGLAGKTLAVADHEGNLRSYIQSANYSADQMLRSLGVLQTVYQTDGDGLVHEFEKLIAEIKDYVNALQRTNTRDFEQMPAEIFHTGSLLIGQLLDRHSDALHDLRLIYKQELARERQQSTGILLGSTLMSILFVSVAYFFTSSRITRVFAQKNEAEQSALQCRRKSQLLFDMSHDGIHLLDHQGNVIDCNQAFASMLGYTRDEAKTLNVLDWDGRFSADQIEPKILALIETPAVFETIHRKKNGETFTVEISAGGIELDGKRCLYASSRNIQERKQQQMALAEAKQQAEDLVTLLKEKNARQNQLFAIIGHELRTPAAAIQMLLEQQGVSDMRPFGRDIMASTEHLIAVLDDMRVVTHPEESVNAPVKVDSVDKILRSSLAIMQRYVDAAGLRVHVEVNELARVRCRVKSQLLRQIIFNLVKNVTLHAGASELRIKVFAQALNDNKLGIQIELEDNGRGISLDHQDRVFEAFERSTSEADGLGLGLHVSRTFAREHLHGDLVYRDRPGGGAVFTLSMVLASALEVDGSPKKTVQHNSEIMRELRVLVVEDSDSLRVLADLQLSKLGARVSLAENGQKALQLIDKKDFDLILTDMFMPVMGGLELCKHLRQRNFNVPVIGLTAATVGDEIASLLSAGATEVLAKPLKMDQLLPLVEKHVRRLDSVPVAVTSRTQLMAPKILRSPEMFDLDGLLAQLDQDVILAISQFSDFLRQAEDLLQDMDRAISKNKILLIRQLAHKLKSLALSMRMGRLARSSEAIKAAIEGGHFNETANLKAQLDDVFEQSVAFAEQNIKIQSNSCPVNRSCSQAMSCFNVCRGRFPGGFDSRPGSAPEVALIR